MSAPIQLRPRWRPRLLVAVTLVAGLVASAGAWWVVDNVTERAIEARFARAAASVATRVDSRLSETESAVLATRGLLEATAQTTAPELARFVDGLASGQPVADRFPGLHALVLVDLDGEVELAVPDGAQAAEDAGDTLARPAVDAALRRATDLARPVTMRLPSSETGLAIVAARYADPGAREPTATPEARRAAVVGWILATVDVDRLLTDVVLVAGGDEIAVALRTPDGTQLGGIGTLAPGAPALERDIELDRASGMLEVEVRVASTLPGQVARVADLVLLLGVLLAVAGAGLVWMLVTQRERALAQVAQATTALAASNAELEEGNERLREFAGVVAHDLRGPLTAVHGMITTLALRIGDELEPLDAELLARAKRGSIQMDELIVDVLRYAEAGVEPTDLRVLDLERVLAGVVERAEPFRQPGDVIDVAVTGAVLADPTGLRRVLGNLVGNALKYRHPGQPAKVVVRARRERDRILIEVADDGPGIAPELRTDVLAPFRRADTSREGSGLGLAICSRIVAHHGGNLQLDEADIGGVLVRFDLPAA